MSVLDDEEPGDVVRSDVMDVDGVLYLVEKQSVRKLDTSQEELENLTWDVVRGMGNRL